MNARFLTPLLWSGLWLGLMAVALLIRPILPVDETRYLAVAWEMWRDGEFWVPHLNGATYSHKPPLLFWLINAGWAVFGVNDWWPRLVAPLFGLGSLFLTAHLARQLWPQSHKQDNAPEADHIALAAPLILLGMLFWTLFTTLTMFDVILTFFTLLSLIGVVRAWKGKAVSGFVLLAAGIGLGGVAKGPAILLHTLPVALLAPYWGRVLADERKGSLAGWYGGLALALAGGLALALAWAVPAGLKGGDAYRDAIFWGQSARRVVASFAHGRPWWWYLATLPAMVLPWLIWPTLWRGLRGLGNAFGNGGVRFCLAWFLPAFAIFSLISGKQLHYLLPELPALSLVFAFVLLGGVREFRLRRRDQVIPGLIAAILGMVIFFLPSLKGPVQLPSVAGQLDLFWGLAIAAAGLAAATLRPRALLGRVAMMTGLSVALIVAVHLAARPLLADNFDLRPISQAIGQWQRQGRTIANFSKYHGQYHFLGRLERPIIPIGLVKGDKAAFLRDHPDGLIVSYHEVEPQVSRKESKPLFVQPYRGKVIVVWEAATVRENPSITNRNNAKR